MLPTVVNRSTDLVQFGISWICGGIMVGSTIYLGNINRELYDKLIARNKELSESNQKCIKLFELTERQEALIDKQDALMDKKHDYIIKHETVNELQGKLIMSQADTINRFDKRIDTPLELK